GVQTWALPIYAGRHFWHAAGGLAEHVRERVAVEEPEVPQGPAARAVRGAAAPAQVVHGEALRAQPVHDLDARFAERPAIPDLDHGGGDPEVADVRQVHLDFTAEGLEPSVPGVGIGLPFRRLEQQVRIAGYLNIMV